MKKRIFIGTLTKIRGIGGIRSLVRAVGVSGKWVEEKNIHFTYRFLGYVEEEAIPEMTAEIKRVLRGVSAPLVEYRGLGFFPSAGFPRVLWVGVVSPGVGSVKEKIDTALKEFGFPPEETFTPHVTLLRIKRVPNFASFKALVSGMEGRFFEKKVERKVQIIESRLTPKGPIYSVVEEIVLD